MIHKLLAGKGKMKRGLSLLLCLALLGCSVISTNVTAEAESDVVEAVELLEESDAETTDVTEITETTEEITGIESEEEDVAEITVESTSEAIKSESTEDISETTAVAATEYTSETEMPAVVLNGSAGDVSVTVNAPEGAFAKGVKMVVSETDVDAFADAVVEDCVASDGGTYTVYDAAAVEISFYDTDGTEVQPATAVKVTLGDLDLNTGDNDLTKYAIIYHMDDDGNMEYITDGEPGESSYSFSASSFSTYGLIIASVEYGTSAAVSGSTTTKVYYDTVTISGSSIAANNSSVGIESVKITGGSATNSGTVAHENAKSNSWSADTTTLTYTNSSDETVKITVEPADGYYVTYITVCCTGPNSNTVPTSCLTWNGANAYEAGFTISDQGVIEVNVSLNGAGGFKHSGAEKCSIYFVLIAVAKIPSPLYVEYEYGDIVASIKAEDSSLSTSAFDTADGWTTVASGNNYGTTSDPMTDYTQYVYTYSSNSDSSEAGWEHNANSITQDAIDQAAAAGYYFVGWEATYYTTCTATENSSGSYNNYTYTFSGEYGTTTDYYQPDDSVKLTVHVKLVAQWVKVEPDPGTLTITKNVDGLTDAEKEGLSITFTVTNSSGENVGTVTLPTASGDWSYKITGLYPGTYTITETGYDVGGYSCVTSSTGGTSSGNPTTVVLSATITRSDTVGSNGLYTYTGTTNDGAVTFTNTYTASPVSLSVTKLVSGNMGDTSKSFSFTLSVKDTEGNAYSDDLTYTLNDTENTKQANADGTYTFTLSHNDTIVFTEIPYGYSIVVEEASYMLDGYETTYTVDGGTVQDESTYENTEITADITLVFTNKKTISAPTGLTTDVAPYVAALAIALGGAVLMFISRRRRV